MVDVTSLFNSTSMTPPRPSASASAINSEALASALLMNILADLAALKEAMTGQMRVNHVLNDFAVEQFKINLDLIAAGNGQIEVNARQAESNAAQNTCNVEAAKMFGQLAAMMEAHNKLVEVAAEMDERLHALDGKRSVGEAPAQTGEPHG